MQNDADLLARLGLATPIFQAPMAGVATPALAAAASNAGALGGLGLGAAPPEAARAQIRETRALTGRPFAVNLFCHRPARPDPAREAAWCDRLAPVFARFGADPPPALTEIYRSFTVDDAMFAMLLDEAPAVVSFHFGLPARDRIAALKDRGILTLASATSPAEARAIAAAGCDAIIAQGWEAGGHRGIFDPDGPDAQLGTLPLTRLILRETPLPCIAAGGIMDGAGIRAALALGATAAQLGTAFISCPESAADAGYRAALRDSAATQMTRVLSGRPARCLDNGFTAWGAAIPPEAIPDYPIAYDAAKALNAAAKAAGEPGFGAQWAGQAFALSRGLPAAELVAALRREMETAG